MSANADDHLRDTLACFTAHSGPHAGQNLASLSDSTPTLLALLRHTGCPFCQEAMADITRALPELDERGVTPVLVFQTPDAGLASALAATIGLEGIDVVTDPDRALYRAFEIPRGNVWQVFGPRVMLGVVRTLTRGLRPAKKVGGDVLQLPGTVLVHKGKVLGRYVHRHQADRANYKQIACALPASGPVGPA